MDAEAKQSFIRERTALRYIVRCPIAWFWAG